MAGLPHQQLRTLQGGGHRAGDAFRAAAGVQQLAVGAVEGHGDGLHLVVDVGDLHLMGGPVGQGDGHRVVSGQLQGGGGAGDGAAAVLLRSDGGDGAALPGGGGGEGHRPTGGGGLRQGDGEVLEGRGGNGFRILVAKYILIGNVSAVGIDGQGVGGGKGVGGIGGHRVQHPDGQVGGEGHLALAAGGGGDGGLRRGIGDVRNRTVGMVVLILIYARIAQIVLAGQGDLHRVAGGAIGVLAVDEQVYTTCLAVFRVIIGGGVFHLVDAGIACAAAGPSAVGDDIRQGRGDGGAAGVFEGESEAAQIQPLGAVVAVVIVRNYRCQAESAFAHCYIAVLVEGDPRRQDVYVAVRIDVLPGEIAVLVHQLDRRGVAGPYARRHLRLGQVQAKAAVQGNGDGAGRIQRSHRIRQEQGAAVEGQGLLRVLAQVCELHPQAARPVGGELHFKGGVGVMHRDDQGLGGGVVPVGQKGPVPDDVFPLHQVERGCGGRPLAVHSEGQRGVVRKGWVVLDMDGIFA